MENLKIYLNDNLPDDPKFNTMWMETKEIFDQGKIILLMVGGAGGAYSELFSDFKTYYPLLRDLLREKTYIGGIDLDIETNEVVVDKDQKTNIDGIYAAGDLTNGSNLKQTITAASQGAISALSAYNYCLENKN